jgi:hypothetical protein
LNSAGNGIWPNLPDLLNPVPPVADVKASGSAQINRASTYARWSAGPVPDLRAPAPP